METIEIKTLIDINNSGIKRTEAGKEKEYNQYKNWITFLQCVSLRSIIDYDNAPTVESVDIKGMNFGSKYKGTHSVWTFRFVTDRKDVYLKDDNKIGLLVNDLHQVPIMEKLDETINIPKPVFDLESPQWTNTTVTLIDTGK